MTEAIAIALTALIAMNMPADRRQARVIAAAAALLAILLGAVTLQSDCSRSLPFYDALDGGPGTIRVKLRRLGDGPWTIGTTSGPLLLESRGTTTVTVDARLSRSGRGIRIDGSMHEQVRLWAEDRGDLVVDGAAYPGVLVASGRNGLVLEVPIEVYVALVLPGEMPLEYPPAALEVQAIAIRTYAVATAHRRADRGWDVVDTEASQVFRGRGTGHLRARDIVARTRGAVLTHDGRPFRTYFSAACGGATRSCTEAFNETEIPPLAGSPCGFCDWAPEHSWSTRLDLDGVAQELGLPDIRSAVVRGAEVSGYDAVLGFRTSRGTITSFPATRLRRIGGAHRVKSTWITGLTVKNGRLIVSGRGFGHGVGLCQKGARGMAKAGHDAAAILARYYPGAVPRRLH